MVTKVNENGQKYDELRASIPYISKPNMFVTTIGISSMSVEDMAIITEKVKTFDTFTEDNDPYGEHDFGSVEHKGQKIFWKIDNYRGHDGIELVLTIMLADEY